MPLRDRRGRTLAVSGRSVTADALVAPAVDGVVSRLALFGRLRAARRVTEVSAPAGSGKTVLLRSWIGQTGICGRAAWVAAQEEEPRTPRSSGWAATCGRWR
jgi:LuxR family maltose regulon positive regulatory protein